MCVLLYLCYNFTKQGKQVPRIMIKLMLHPLVKQRRPRRPWLHSWSNCDNKVYKNKDKKKEIFQPHLTKNNNRFVITNRRPAWLTLSLKQQHHGGEQRNEVKAQPMATKLLLSASQSMNSKTGGSDSRACCLLNQVDYYLATITSPSFVVVIIITCLYCIM